MSHLHTHTTPHHHGDLKGKKLLLTIVLNCIITLSQVIGGILSGSLALLSDALHNFTDVVSLVISYIADLYTKKDASYKKTFGYKRAEIIAAFINSLSLLVIALFLIYEAIIRFLHPQSIESNLVIGLALLAIAANGFSVLLLKKDSQDNMNMRSAYLHLFTDMTASIAVLVGGLVMKYFEWFWVDSVLTIAIAIYLLVMGYDLLKASFKVLMLFTPDSIKIEEINEAIVQFPEIKNVHHIHIWQVNEDEIHLEAHIDFYKDISLSEFDTILVKIESVLEKKYGINHINIQPEYQKEDTKDIIVQD